MITTYSELQASVLDWSYRTDIVSRVPEFIQLCEADMQVRCKLTDFEGYATIALTAGIGALPTGFTGMRSVYWDGNLDRPLDYITPDRFDALSASSGPGRYYTITGDTIKVSPSGDGSVVMTYKARFTPLSDSSATNVLLTRYPDAYLRGSLLQFATWAQDDVRAAKEDALFQAAITRIVTDNNQRKYAGATLQVRPR